MFVSIRNYGNLAQKREGEKFLIEKLTKQFEPTYLDVTDISGIIIYYLFYSFI